jgi:N-methylhydantoinase A
MRKVRIGIDVGGTFTDAVAIDDSTYEVIAQEKQFTTHAEAGGVAVGVIKILQDILRKNNIAPEDVVFIAHGTTQATNALLEGDVAKVGILALGTGLEGMRAKSDSNIASIPLGQHKKLQVEHTFLEAADVASCPELIDAKIAELFKAGAQVIVATEPFSVDHPENERFIIDRARSKGYYATGGCEVSQLYGLKVRTRTAVINGSLIPKMMETADMTENCVKKAGITTPLMIMRCDGGVMTVGEVRQRPILTMVSGLAAGVAGALMYEHLSDGIFLESGGTSTDISAVKNGRVMISYAQVGGHKTYLHSLDVRTLGVAGGSMIRVENGKVTDVGPRSTHIAGLDYEVFSEPLLKPHLELLAPKLEDDKAFAVAVDAQGRKVALTLAGAANLLGMLPEKDYALGNKEAARVAWQALGDYLGISAVEAATQAMDVATTKIRAVVEGLIRDYELDTANLCLAGGGGSAGVVVPYLAKAMHLHYKIVRNAPIISTIGVALAMVREVVERTVLNPTDEDIASIRQEALEHILKSGANAGTVEIALEIDKKSNILRAIATGATELRTKNLAAKKLTLPELQKIAAASMQLPVEGIQEIASTDAWHIFDGPYQVKCLGLWKQTKHKIRVLDRDGIIRLQKDAVGVLVTSKAKWTEELPEFLDLHTEYGTIGGQLPQVYAYYGEKQLDLSGLVSQEQITALLQLELTGVPKETAIILIAVRG